MNKQIIAGLLASVVLAACGSQEQQSVLLRPVKTMVVGEGSNTVGREYNGLAQTDRVVNLSFRSNGIITAFNIKLGQKINKGDVLAELDNVAARLAYEQAVSSLNSARSDKETKQLNLERVRSLYEKGGLSLSDYESAKNAFKNAEANYFSALRSVDIQLEQINYGKIIAPESGVIAAVNKEIDENVNPGETVAILNAGTDMEIQVGLPESVINQVATGDSATISFAALPDDRFAGEVSEISPAIDRNTATYPVRVRLLGQHDQIRSGMAATVVFDVTAADQSGGDILVPATAVGEDANGRFVFSITEQNDTAIVIKRYIELGNLLGTEFSVNAGLNTGDVIVIAGVHSVLDGQQIRID